jgi:hypothetical protein
VARESPAEGSIGRERQEEEESGQEEDEECGRGAQAKQCQNSQNSHCPAHPLEVEGQAVQGQFEASAS